MLIWKKEFETGYEPIDAEHRMLVEKINEFGRALKDGTARASVDALVTFIERYTREHFAHEERCMHSFECPSAQANKRAHAQFLRKFGGLSQKLSEGHVSSATLVSLHQGMCSWLRNHILTVDKELGRCITKRPAGR